MESTLFNNDTAYSLVILVVVGWFLRSWHARRGSERRSLGTRCVLVTGCDSGFGRRTAVHLSNLGFHVFAACLEEDSVASYSELEPPFNGEAFRLDVTKQEDVDGAVAIVDARMDALGQTGLYGLVNNAGVLAVGPIEWQTLATMRHVMDVNLWGTVRVTRAFLPLVKRAEGRIVNLSSMAGKMLFTHAASYSMSKYAVEAFSDGLRNEMRPWGVSVHVIEPGMFKTKILDQDGLRSKWDRVWSELPPHLREQYGQQYFEKGKHAMSELLVNVLASSDLGKVTSAIAHALTSPTPRDRCMVGWDAHLLWCWVAWLPTGLSDGLLHLVAKLPTPAARQK